VYFFELLPNHFNFDSNKQFKTKEMKKANQILILCFFTAIIFSCSKKASDSVSPAIVGKWKDAGLKGTITINFMGQVATEPLDEAATGNIVEFKSDGTVENLSALGDETQFTKYKTSGNLLTLTGTEAGKPIELAFNYSVSGSTLLLTMDKALFGKNLVVIAAADPTSDLADLKEFVSFITDFKYEHTLIKQ
jgi:hypothetical protein